MTAKKRTDDPDVVIPNETQEDTMTETPKTETDPKAEKQKQKSALYTRAQSLLRQAHAEEFEQILTDVYAEAGLTYVNRSKAKAEREAKEAEEKARRKAEKQAKAEEKAKAELEALFEKFPHLRPGAAEPLFDVTAEEAAHAPNGERF